MGEVEIHHIEEHVVDGKRLGRHVHHDPASRNFPAARAPRIVTVDHRAKGLPLNQGTLGSCTANALCGALNSAPDYTGGALLTEADAVRLYGAETRLEGKPHPPHDPGGSGLLVCKAAKDEGMISSYTHAFGREHALLALVLRPVIVGINWYSSFDTPTAAGEVQIAKGATNRGGHEVLADGIDADRELVWLWNSWGTTFGKGGRFCMSFDTLDQLLALGGDVTVPIR